MKNLIRGLFGNRSALDRPLKRPKSRVRAIRGYVEELEGRLLLNSHPLGEVPHHIHPHLMIFIDGQNFTIPAQIGIDDPSIPGPIIGTPNENAHTHTADGVIHFNEQTAIFRDLKEFFDTWGAEFDQTHIKLPNTGGGFTERTVDATHTIRFFVNGAASTDFQDYEPEDGDQIVISFEEVVAAGAPLLNPINNVTMVSNSATGSPARTFFVPLDGSDPSGTLTYAVTTGNAGLTATLEPATNRFLRLNVSGKDIDGNNFTGDLIFQLFDDLTPNTVNRILQLVQTPKAGGGFFYDGLTFHRVVNDFVAQGGDPSGNGSGGSGVNFSDEFNAAATFTGFGQLAMANSGDDTNDSQFFITDSNLSLLNTAPPQPTQTTQPPTHLNFNHTIFGQLVSGFDTFNKMMLTPVSGSTPTTPVVINTATIVTDNQHAVLRLSASTGFTGNSTVTVTATNGSSLTDQRQFLVSVASDAVNDRPFLEAIPPQATTIGKAFSFVIPATDLENDTLTFAVGSTSNFLTGNAPNNLVNNPLNATVTLDQATHRLTITPATGFQGNLTIKVGVRDATHGTDASGFDTQVLTIPVGVNQAPTPTAQTANTTLNTSRIITLTGDDGDSPAVQTLTFRIRSLPASGTLRDSNNHTVVTADLAPSGYTLPNATVTYTPNTLFAGADNFTFDAKDDGLTTNGGVDTSVGTATVTMNVGPNLIPTANAQSATVVPATSGTITLTGDDGDAAIQQTLTFFIVTLPANGTLKNSAGVTLTTANIVNPLPSATVTYTAGATFVGNDPFTFKVMDDGGTTGGGVDTSAPATLTVTVPTNNKPTASPQTVSPDQSIDEAITLTGDDGEPNASQTISFVVQTLPTHGRIVDSAGHVVTTSGTTVPTSGVTYSPDLGFTGSDSFTFVVKDNGGTTGGGLDTSNPAIVSITVAATTRDSAVSLHDGTLRIQGTAEADTITVDLNAAADRLEVTLNDGDKQVFELSRVQTIRVTGDNGDDEITIDANTEVPAHVFGGRGNDTINGGNGPDNLQGGRGDDLIDGGGGNDRIFGSRGADTMDGAAGKDRLSGGRENDSLDGGANADIVDGGRDDDDLSGSDDNDRLFGRSGDDTVDGGNGNDLVNGGLGNDSLIGGDGNDQMVGGPKLTEFQPIPDGDDTIAGGNGNDTLSGREGDDELSGGNGNDVLKGGTGNDSMDGGPGTDRINGRQGNDSMEGGTGIDTLRGGRGLDDFGQNLENDVRRDFDQDVDTEQPVTAFPSVTTGDFTDSGLLGERTDLRPGAPDVTVRTHDNTIVDTFYTQNGFSNPPTYGPHRNEQATAGDPQGAPVQPTGVYTVAQPDFALVHNLEHGHVWISYNPTLISAADLAALQQLVRDGANNTTGAGVGVVLTPRPGDTTAIVLTSWAHLQTLNSLNAQTVRNFIVANRGHAPEGFETP